MDVGVIINPVAGASRSHSVDKRKRLAHEVIDACHVDGDVRLTHGRGSATTIAGEMIGAGAATVVAWGGDGTINEIAKAVASAGGVLGVVPGGTGNGFARGLGIERRSRAALRTALAGAERRIDTGEIDQRFFVNVAGVGFDAHLASVFNRLPSRSAAAYIRASLRELSSYRALSYTVRGETQAFTTKALFVTVANGPEYGAGAVIAPMACIDDGALDLICVPPRNVASLYWQARHLFTGTIDQIPDVRFVTAPTMEIVADRPLVFHVDGEVYEGSDRLQIKVKPSSLRVRVPPPGRIGTRRSRSRGPGFPGFRRAPDLGVEAR